MPDLWPVRRCATLLVIASTWLVSLPVVGQDAPSSESVVVQRRLDDLEERLDETRHRLDKYAQSPFVDEKSLRFKMGECESTLELVHSLFESSDDPGELDALLRRADQCLIDLSYELESDIDLHENIVFGGPLLFLMVILPIIGFALVRLRRETEDRRLDVMDAITEWDERRPILEARLEHVRDALGLHDVDEQVEPESVGLTDEQALDIAFAFTLLSELQYRFDEARRLQDEAGSFGAMKMNHAVDQILDGEFQLGQADIDSESPLSVDVKPFRTELRKGIPSLEQLTERAESHVDASPDED